MWEGGGSIKDVCPVRACSLVETALGEMDLRSSLVLPFRASRESLRARQADFPSETHFPLLNQENQPRAGRERYQRKL